MINYLKKYKKPLFFLFMLLVIGLILESMFTIEMVQSISEKLQQQYTNNPVLLLAGFCLLYVTQTSLSMPFSSALSVLSGAVFGLWLGGLVVIVCASIGATLAFLVSRRFLEPQLQKRYPELSKKVVSEINHSSRLYLLTARLAPIMPFYLINLFAGLGGMKIRDFTIITAIGIVPGSLALSYAGSRIEQAITNGRLLEPQLLIALSILGGLSLIGGLYNRSKTKEKIV